MPIAFLRKIAVFLFFVFLSLVALCVGLGLVFYSSIEEGLPSIESLKHYRPPVVTTMYGADGSTIAEFHHQRRYIVPFREIPRHVKQAFLAAEDARFYEHPGIDIWGIIRAAIVNIRAGTIVQGGSTITQQVVKALLLSPERTLRRKLREALLAYKIDQTLSKDEIFNIYLNHVYFGAGAYGVEAAARVYFGKHVQDLTVAEAAMLAGLPKAPSRFNPYKNPKAARARQLYVIRRMEEEHFITPEEAAQARKAPLITRNRMTDSLPHLNHFVEYLRQKLIDQFGEKTFYEDGLQIYTTLDPRAQALAQDALIKGLKAYDKRHGFRGPKRILTKDEIQRWKANASTKHTGPTKIGKTTEALVISQDDRTRTFQLLIGKSVAWLQKDGWKWTGYSYRSLKRILPPGAIVDVVPKKKVNNEWIVNLDQTPEVEGAVLCVNPHTGEVLCMVGGKDFSKSQFNRVTQPKRQPGSAFKPIIYSVAIEHGFTEASILVDSPVIRPDPSLQGPWKPANYDGKFMGPVTLRKALALSRNVVAIKLLDTVGIEPVISYARKMGIMSHLTPTLSLALGASGVSLWELAHAYTTFANSGSTPVFRCITRILDRDGKTIMQTMPESRPVLSPETAYIITDMLKAVIREGTGRYARRLKRPAAGKTGTTNDFRDAWFMGYTPDLFVGIWVGYDNYGKSLGKNETGGRVACPIWTDFMIRWCKGKPIKDFPTPSGIVFVRVNLGNNEGIKFLPFKIGYVPKILSDVNKVAPHREQESDESSIYKSELF